jgi:hypothetical protein
MLLLNSLQSFGGECPLICALKVVNEHDTELVPVVGGSFG